MNNSDSYCMESKNIYYLYILSIATNEQILHLNYTYYVLYIHIYIITYVFALVNFYHRYSLYATLSNADQFILSGQYSWTSTYKKH